MKQLIILSAISCLSVNNINAQESCKVSVDALQGTYTGACKDGRADGQGKAVGTDSYEGSFKAGYPEGEGVYTWANKDVYTGSFKKGVPDGRGEIRYYTASGKDSVLTGFWKKNRYMGRYEKAYVINDRSSKVNRAEVSISNKGKNVEGSVTLTASQLSGADGNTGHVIPTVTDISIIAGQYLSKSSNSLSNSSVLKIRQLIFPFRARFTFSNGEMVDITFNEQADYEVTLTFL